MISIGLIAAVSATDAAIQKKILGSKTAPITANEEIDDVMKIVKSLKDSGLLIKDVKETVKTEAKERWVSRHVIRYIN